MDIDIKSKNNIGQTALDALLIENEGLEDVKAMLEEEYSKIDAVDPPLKRQKK